MTVLVLSLIAIAAILVGVKVYFQEKEKEELKQAVPTLEKTHEQIVAERLQEIAKFEAKEVEEKQQTVVDPVVVVEDKKPKANKHKKYYKPKKQQPKIKAK